MSGGHGDRDPVSLPGGPVPANVSGPEGSLPVAASSELAPYVETLVEHIVDAVLDVAPQYHRPTVETMIEGAVRYALALSGSSQVITMPGWRGADGADGPATLAQLHEFCWSLGRTEYAAGRSLEVVYSANHAAGRAAWQFLSDHLGKQGKLSHEWLHQAADSIFATVESVSTLIGEGYAAARGEAGDHPDPVHARLLSLILSQPAPSERAVRVLAESAGWPVPGRVVVVILDDSARYAGLPLPPGVLRHLDADPPCLVVPVVGDDAPLQMLHGHRAVVGPAMPAHDAGRSLSCARWAAELRDAGVLPDEPVLRCSEYLLDMMLVSDPLLVDELAKHTFGRNEVYSLRQQERQVETLLSWLRRRGSPAEAAQELALHPQTVRYRMGQLRDVFGDRLDNPDDRFAMHIALAAARLLGRTPDPATWHANLTERAVDQDDETGTSTAI